MKIQNYTVVIIEVNLNVSCGFKQRRCRFIYFVILGHFTVLCFVAKPLNRTEPSQPKPRFHADAR